MIEESQLAMIIALRENIDRIIAQVDNCGEGGENAVSKQERVLPLSINPIIFRKQKPVAVIFGETRVPVKTWGDVYIAVLANCTQEPEYYNKLMEQRGRIAGKSKVFIAETSDGMRRPRKVCEGLYADVIYGSETLMYILVERILKTIGYNCSNIYIVLSGCLGSAANG